MDEFEALIYQSELEEAFRYIKKTYPNIHGRPIEDYRDDEILAIYDTMLSEKNRTKKTRQPKVEEPSIMLEKLLFVSKYIKFWHGEPISSLGCEEINKAYRWVKKMFE